MSFSEFVQQARRVLRLARKPTREEFIRTAKITGIGIILLGFIGYVIHMIYYLLTTYL